MNKSKRDFSYLELASELESLSEFAKSTRLCRLLNISPLSPPAAASASLSMEVLLTFGPKAPTLLLAVSEDRSVDGLSEWSLLAFLIRSWII